MAYRMNGLNAANPQGWMAAIGVIYILKRRGKNILMHWEHLTPVLDGINQRETHDTLLEYKEQSDLLDNIPILPGEKKCTLDLTGGTVILTKEIGKMIKIVTERHMTEALDNPWLNKDNIASLGWDVGATKLASTLPGDKPPNTAEHKGVTAAQWLASESLPVVSPEYKVRNRSFAWVTWGVPLDFPGVRSVVFSENFEWNGLKFKSKANPNGNLNYFSPSVIIESCEP